MGDQQKSEKSLKPKVRMCKLNKDGKLDEVEAHSVKPIVVCSKCKAKANDPGYLCNPRTLKA
jgi:hypothetical protein